MSHNTLQILFMGDLPVWLKLAQTVVEAPGASVQLHRATSLRDAMHCLAAEEWDTVFVDFRDPAASELLSALQLHSVFREVPVVALLASADPQPAGLALSSGATSFLSMESVTPEAISQAALGAIASKRASSHVGNGGAKRIPAIGSGNEVFPSSKIEAISHALNNLLCVISANADILADQVAGSHPGVRNLDQIKKATKTAAELMRHLKLQ